MKNAFLQHYGTKVGTISRDATLENNLNLLNLSREVKCLELFYVSGTKEFHVVNKCLNCLKKTVRSLTIL